MGDYLDSILAWIAQHPEQSGWVIFAIACIESLAIIGAFIPGAIILVGVGALISTGVLDLWTSCLWATAGAIVGDGLSYILGQRFKDLSQRWQWLRINPDYLQKGIDFFQRYGDISIILGRFLGPTRAIVPLAAGMLHMPAWRFYIANIFSAIIWAPAYLVPGFILGQTLSQQHVGYILAALLVITSMLLAWYGLRRWRCKEQQ